MNTAFSEAKLKQIKLLLLDVDGVLTDGSVIYNDDTSESKVFNVKDGLGLKLLIKAGISVGLVTGRTSKALHRRCDDLGIKYVYDGVEHKAHLLDRITADTGIETKNTAFVGDDLPDIPLMKMVGFSIAVADAHDTVREHSDWVTSAPGGRGAVREVCDALLKAHGKWEEMVEEFLV
jgi:3-deoxy-D-manno-octulosonate 8-phosphate phosphatase (KDO 8-P phosphatase)